MDIPSVSLPFALCEASLGVGLRSAEDFHTLRDVLQGNSAHLTRFQLDFLSWTEADNSWYTDRVRRDEERSENYFGKKREEAIGMSCVILEVIELFE